VLGDPIETGKRVRLSGASGAAPADPLLRTGGQCKSEDSERGDEGFRSHVHLSGGVVGFRTLALRAPP
jgi:hypothetical protein